MNTRTPFELTEERQRHLERRASEGAPFYKVAAEFGVSDETVKNAAIRQRIWPWFRALYPARKKAVKVKGEAPKPKQEYECRPDGLRKLKPEQIAAPLNVPNNPQTRWLTKEWRSAA